MQTFRQSIQASLTRAGVYQRLRASSVSDLYWNIADKGRIDARHKEMDFYRSLFDGFHRGDLIFDVGANDGRKTDVFLRLGARVIAVEPDEHSQQVIREKFLKLRLARKPVVIVGKAVSDKVTTETMWIDRAGSSLNTLSHKWVETLKGDKARFKHTNSSLEFAQNRVIETTTLDDLIVAHGLPFFIKIDVEGYEGKVLRGLKYRVPLVSFEANLPEFKPEALECVELLSRLSADGKFNYAADGQQSLALETWLDAGAFSQQLEKCSLDTIEVLCKNCISNLKK
jgi:FkbM family methyltransferase